MAAAAVLVHFGVAYCSAQVPLTHLQLTKSVPGKMVLAKVPLADGVADVVVGCVIGDSTAQQGGCAANSIAQHSSAQHSTPQHATAQDSWPSTEA